MSGKVLYKSTRGGCGGQTFEQVVLQGLAPDRGLFIPERIPACTKEDLERMRLMNFTDLTFEILSKFITEDDVPYEILRDIILRSFSTFRSPEVTPSVKLTDFWVLELFHGPTYAFKDVALQFLGNLFEFFLARGNIQSRLTILGATSGDTGSAAIHGLRGKKNIHCFILYPIGKVTEVQERQMTTVPDKNIHCIGIEGDFDDAQNIVKSAFADESFRKSVNLGAINSINWARVLVQITYYFYAYFRVSESIPSNSDSHSNVVNFAVPTGNFGDSLAGYYAKLMGLPIGKLAVCTNDNDVLNKFFNSGVYRRVPSRLTIAPSMDISVSSNFERYLFYLAGESSATLSHWMDVYELSGQLSVNVDSLKKARNDFVSNTTTESSIIETMRRVFDSDNYLMCPHSATAAHAVSILKLPSHNTVCLATAHPAKFEDAIHMALIDGRQIPPRPPGLQELFALPMRTTVLPNSLQRVKAFINDRLCENGFIIASSDDGSDLAPSTHRPPLERRSWTPLGTMVVCVSGLFAVALYRSALLNKH